MQGKRLELPVWLAGGCKRLSWLRWVLPLSVLVLNGCYAGLAGVALLVTLAAGGFDEKGGAANSPPEIMSFHVSNFRDSPADIEFEIADAEGNPVDVAIFYTPAEFSPQVVLLPVQLTGGDTRLKGLPTSGGGVTYLRKWDFAAQLARGAAFQPGCTVTLKAGGATRSQVVDLGNDSPGVTAGVQADPDFQRLGEYVGIVLIPLRVTDSSNDLVQVLVEYAVENGDFEGPGAEVPCSTGALGTLPEREPSEPSDLEWHIARPAGRSCTPLFAFPPVQAPNDLKFFWDVLADLKNSEVDVRLRFTPYDGLAWGEPVQLEGPALHIDNNDRPIASLDGQSFVLNPDRGGGIPIPFDLRDPESDAVRLVFQWRLATQSFDDSLELPSDRSEIEAILADPEERRRLHIAGEQPVWLTGTVIPVAGDNSSVRVPELGTSAAMLPAEGPEHLQLEVLRPTGGSLSVPASTGSWDIESPAGAIPVGDGLAALVLDSPAQGSWRLREMSLTTGEVNALLVPSGAGVPSAMVLERGAETALVAAGTSRQWSLWRVSLVGEGSSVLFNAGSASQGVVPDGIVRDIVSLGTDSALVTLQDSLVRLNYPEGGQGRVSVVLDDLQGPWGLAQDPRDSRRVFIGEGSWKNPGPEKGEGRVLRLYLDKLERTVLPVPAGSLLRPRALTVNWRGTDLLVLTDEDPDDGTRELRSVSLDGGEPAVIDGELPDDAASVACGPDGLTVVSLTAAGALTIGGGVEQRREIVAWDAGHHKVTVKKDFDPPPHPSRTCRILHHHGLVRPASEGTRGFFVWDSRDPPGGNARVVLRVTPYDSEKGVGDTTGIPRPVARFSEVPVLLEGGGPSGRFRPATVADMDGDGDLDIVSAEPEEGTLRVFLQAAPGRFPLEPAFTLTCSGVAPDPVALAAADLDGDGDTDIICADRGGDKLQVFLQASPGQFPTDPDLILGERGATDGPAGIAVADLDSDGDLDIVCANSRGSTLTVFLQFAPGVFRVSAGGPLGGVGVTDGPEAIAVADLDSDGDVDLVCGNSGSGTLTVLLQIAPGVFSSHPGGPLGGEGLTDGPVSVAVADLDGDGDADIVSANSRGDTLTIFFQTSPGDFTPDARGPLGGPESTPQPCGIVAADLDGDGGVDIASLNAGNDTLAVFVQQTPGVFGSAGAAQPDFFLAVPEAPERPGASGFLTAADLDRDGDLDLISASGAIAVFFQGASGALGGRDVPDASLGEGSVVSHPGALVVTDIDGDGYRDVVCSSEDAHNLAVFYQKSPRVFGKEGDFTRPNIVLGSPETTRIPKSVIVADLDADGRQDLVSVNWGSKSLALFFQGPSGTFAEAPFVLNRNGEPFGPMAAVACDLDEDGDLDLAAADFLSGSIGIFFQTGLRQFTYSSDASLETSTAFRIAAMDLDADGDLDLVAGSGAEKDSTVRVFLQVAPGEFSPHPGGALGGPDTTNIPCAIAGADLDGDGYKDILSANKWNNTLTIFFQQSSGEFAQPPKELGGSEYTNHPEAVAIGDLNGDGRPDLACACVGSDTLYLYYQVAPGDFIPAPRGPLGGPLYTVDPAALCIVDIDEDGDADVVSVNDGSNNITIFYGRR